MDINDYRQAVKKRNYIKKRAIYQRVCLSGHLYTELYHSNFKVGKVSIKGY